MMACVEHRASVMVWLQRLMMMWHRALVVSICNLAVIFRSLHLLTSSDLRAWSRLCGRATEGLVHRSIVGGQPSA